jgi:hypothetical protein
MRHRLKADVVIEQVRARRVGATDDSDDKTFCTLGCIAQEPQMAGVKHIEESDY